MLIFQFRQLQAKPIAPHASLRRGFQKSAFVICWHRSSRATSGIFSFLQPCQRDPGQEVKCVSLKRQFSFPADKQGCGKETTFLRWWLSWSSLSPAKESKCINISGTYRKQFCRTPAVNGHGVYIANPAGPRTAWTKHSLPSHFPPGSSLPVPKD